ncbi:hypothetical protein IT570_11065 [Candidatus Sumerlaeota bacterium]|nr:hypothetical protein [Candidatus Sumerlaeota bacterium]
MKRIFCPSLAALLYLASASAPLPADPYSQRMEAFEKESAEPSRMTLYGKAAAMKPAPFDDSSNRIAVIALANPFSQDLSFLKNYAADYDPPAKLFYEATTLKTYKHFAYAQPSDPAPDFQALQQIARFLILRSQANAKGGNLDGAIDDVTAVWIAGHSFETTNDSIPGFMLGISLRVLALDQMSALLETYSLTVEQQTRMIALVTRQPDPPSSVINIILADINTWPAMLKAQNTATPDKLKEASDAMAAAVKPLAEMDFQKQRASFEGLEKAREQAETVIGKNRAVPVGDLLTRKAVADAKQAVLLSGLCVSIANNQNATGKATNEEIGFLAAPIQKYLIDPFTGEAPRINNAGNGKFMVISAGPDAVFEKNEMKVYSSRFGLASGGDIYLQRK